MAAFLNAAADRDLGFPQNCSFLRNGAVLTDLSSKVWLSLVEVGLGCYLPSSA